MPIGTNKVPAAGTNFSTAIQSPASPGLMQVASAYAEAFDALLDAYQQIGESIPLLSQYQTLFARNPHMRKVLEMIYADILEFHKKALKYFQQRSLFRSSIRI
jgi:hypothetical protein